MKISELCYILEKMGYAEFEPFVHSVKDNISFRKMVGKNVVELDKEVFKISQKTGIKFKRRNNPTYVDELGKIYVDYYSDKIIVRMYYYNKNVTIIQ